MGRSTFFMKQERKKMRNSEKNKIEVVRNKKNITLELYNFMTVF
jgi:hypothetical protein